MERFRRVAAMAALVALAACGSVGGGMDQGVADDMASGLDDQGAGQCDGAANGARCDDGDPDTDDQCWDGECGGCLHWGGRYTCLITTWEGECVTRLVAEGTVCSAGGRDDRTCDDRGNCVCTCNIQGPCCSDGCHFDLAGTACGFEITEDAIGCAGDSDACGNTDGELRQAYALQCTGSSNRCFQRSTSDPEATQIALCGPGERCDSAGGPACAAVSCN